MSNRFQDRGFVQVGGSVLVPVIVKPIPAANATIASLTLAATTTTTLLAANSNRLGATIYNNTTGTLYVAYGAGATTTNYSVALDGNGAYLEVPFNYTGIITGYSVAGGAAVLATEFTA